MPRIKCLPKHKTQKVAIEAKGGIRRDGRAEVLSPRKEDECIFLILRICTVWNVGICKIQEHFSPKNLVEWSNGWLAPISYFMAACGLFEDVKDRHGKIPSFKNIQ